MVRPTPLLSHPDVLQDIDRGLEGLASYCDPDHVGSGFDERTGHGSEAAEASAAPSSSAATAGGHERNTRDAAASATASPASGRNVRGRFAGAGRVRRS